VIGRSAGRAGLTTVAVLLLGATLAGCDGEPNGPSGGEPTANDALKPTVPSSYMEDARDTWNAFADREPFQPYRDGDLQWDGDPRDYERVCGADFLLADDSIPEFYGAPDGGTTAGDETTYYEWLQADPERWAAFNAWLNDPAVVYNLAPRAENFDLGYGRQQQRTGDPGGCPDAAEQVAQPVS